MSQDIDSRISELPEALTILPGDLVPIVQQGVNKRAVASLFVAGGDSGSGWSPLFASPSDGARQVLQITDWTGGTGTKPTVGYLGTSGLVQDIAQAVDIRGPQGPAGDDGEDGADGQAGAAGHSPVYFSGSVVPSSGTGANGDIYLRDNGDLYGKTAGAWALLGNLKGPQGESGEDGTAVGSYLGVYATLSALETAHPAAQPGDWAQIKTTGQTVKNAYWDAETGWEVFDEAGVGAGIINPIDWASHPSAVFVLDADAEQANFSDNAQVATPTNFAFGSLVNVSKSGTAAKLIHASGSTPAYYDMNGVYWDAGSKADFDFLHRNSGASVGGINNGPVTIKALFWLPANASGTQMLMQSNGGATSKRGISVYFDANGGTPILDGSICYALGGSGSSPFFENDGGNVSNVILGGYVMLTIEYQYGRTTTAEIRSWINGLPSFRGNGLPYKADPTDIESTHLFRIGAQPDGSLPFAGRLLRLGMFKNVFSEDEQRGLDRDACEKNVLPVLGRMLDGARAYNQFPASELTLGLERKYWILETPNHITFDYSRTIEYISPDGGWSWSGYKTLFASTGPDATATNNMQVSRIGSTLFAVGGTDPLNQASVRKSVDAKTWSAPLFLNGGFAGGPLVGTYTEGYVFQFNNVDLGVPVYGDTSGSASVKIMRSSDDGATWVPGPVIASGYEACFRRLSNNTIFGVIDSRNARVSGIYSTDDGATWSSVFKICDASNCRPVIAQMASGRIALAYREVNGVNNGRGTLITLPAAAAAANNFVQAGWSSRIYYDPIAGFYMGAHLTEPEPGVLWIDFAREESTQQNAFCKAGFTTILESTLAEY